MRRESGTRGPSTAGSSRRRKRRRGRERERERVAQAEECRLEASCVGKPIVESMMQKCSSMAVQEILDATVEDTAVGQERSAAGRVSGGNNILTRTSVAFAQF